MKLTKTIYREEKSSGKNDWEIRLDYKMSKEELQQFKIKNRLTRPKIPDDLLAKSQELGITKDAVFYRYMVKGWSLEEACSTPKDIPLISTKKLKKACKELSINPTTIYRRIERGWDVEKALTTPNEYHHKKSVTKKARALTMKRLIDLYNEKKKPRQTVFEYLKELDL